MNFSKIISVILHPIFMPIVTVYLSVTLIPEIRFAITNYLNFIYVIMVISSILLPLMSLFFLIKKGVVSSLEMHFHKERSLPLFTTSLWLTYGYYKLVDILVFAPILRAEIITVIIITVISAGISNYWKISLHMIGVGGMLGALCCLNILFGGLSKIIIFSILLSGLLGVARINEKSHNQAQVYAGFLFGFIFGLGGVLVF